MTKALVTGATGFIGKAVVKALLDLDWEVHSIVRGGCQERKLENVQSHPYYGDIGSMIAAVKTSKPDVVFHLASFFTAEHVSYDIDELVQSNILFPSHLAEAMAVTNVTKLVNTGSSWQHCKETRAYQPQNLYAATKQAAEDIYKYYHDTKELSLITLKLFDTYGPADPRKKLVSILLDAARTEKPISLSPGEQCIDLLHVGDVAQAYVLAGTHLFGLRAINESYLLGGTRLSIRELVTTIDQISGKTIKANWGERPYRNREIMVPVLPYNLPTWEPKIELREGLREAYQRGYDEQP